MRPPTKVKTDSIIFLGVAGTIGWALLTCRAKSGDFSEGHPARGKASLEVLWTVLPLLLLLWVAIQSQHIYQLLNLNGLHAFAHSETKAERANAATNPPLHNLKANAEWIEEEIFDRHLSSSKGSPARLQQAAPKPRAALLWIGGCLAAAMAIVGGIFMVQRLPAWRSVPAATHQQQL